jgi:hypothetical protein
LPAWEAERTARVAFGQLWAQLLRLRLLLSIGLTARAGLALRACHIANIGIFRPVARLLRLLVRIFFGTDRFRRLPEETVQAGAAPNLLLRLFGYTGEFHLYSGRGIRTKRI